MIARELLELAAKAAEIEWSPATTDKGIELESTFGLWLVIHEEPSEYQRRRWNPLTNDGDALRLAVKLGISVDQVRTPMNPYAYAASFDDGFEEGYADNNADPYAATRRAIVRCAAEIGRNMK